MSVEELEIILEDEEELEVELEQEESLDVELENDVVEVVTSDYEKLNNLPQINNVELRDNKTSKDLKLQGEMKEFTNIELEAMFSDL